MSKYRPGLSVPEKFLICAALIDAVEKVPEENQPAIGSAVWTIAEKLSMTRELSAAADVHAAAAAQAAGGAEPDK